VIHAGASFSGIIPRPCGSEVFRPKWPGATLKGANLVDTAKCFSVLPHEKDAIAVGFFGQAVFETDPADVFA